LIEAGRVPLFQGRASTIKVLDFPSLDLTTPEDRGFLAMFSAMAERERLRIVARTREGRRIAMTNGVKMGPPFKLSEHQRKLAAKRMAAGENTRQIARDFNVSHNCAAAVAVAGHEALDHLHPCRLVQSDALPCL
jgi:DNA invertase Pin-like site-specific DNA recombinase